MNTLESVSADDDIGDASTILEDENSAVTAGVLVRVTGDTTVKLGVAIVLAASDDAGLRERRDLTHTRGDVEGLGRSDAGEKGDELDLLELHFD